MSREDITINSETPFLKVLDDIEQQLEALDNSGNTNLEVKTNSLAILQRLRISADQTDDTKALLNELESVLYTYNAKNDTASNAHMEALRLISLIRWQLNHPGQKPEHEQIATPDEVAPLIKDMRGLADKLESLAKEGKVSQSNLRIIWEDFAEADATAKMYLPK